MRGDAPWAMVHPPSFCNKCYRSLKRVEQSGTTTSVKVTFWTKHNDIKCDTCIRYRSSCARCPGRKPKRPKGGIHSSITSGQMLQAIHSLNLTQSLATTVPLHPSRLCVPPDSILLKDFTCETCGDILDQPTETKCRHIMCKLCLCRHLLKPQSIKPSCPICLSEFNSLTDIWPISNTLSGILRKLQIQCDHTDCNVILPLEKLKDHVAKCSPVLASQVFICSPPQSQQSLSKQSTHQSAPTPLTPSKISLKNILQSPLDKTPTKVEQVVASHLIRKMLKKNDNVELPTGGQVLNSNLTKTIY